MSLKISISTKGKKEKDENMYVRSLDISFFFFFTAAVYGKNLRVSKIVSEQRSSTF